MTTIEMMPEPPRSNGRTNVPDASTVTTPLVYNSLQDLYDCLNNKLFDCELPDAFLCFSRRARSGGHYSPKRYSGRGCDLARDEISINPDMAVGRDDEWVASVVLHEMTHHWQEHFGAKKRRQKYAYHDAEFSRKMESLGLLTTSLGMVGGRRTGIRMSHLIIPNGPFQKVFTELAEGGWRLLLESTVYPGEDRKKANKETYVCRACREVSTWGKPNLGLVCKECLLGNLSDLTLTKAKTAQLIDLIERTTMPPKPGGSAQAE